MNYWRVLMILYDTEEQIDFVAKLLADMVHSKLTEIQVKELKTILSDNELALAKVWEELERIIEE